MQLVQALSTCGPEQNMPPIMLLIIPVFVCCQQVLHVSRMCFNSSAEAEDPRLLPAAQPALLNEGHHDPGMCTSYSCQGLGAGCDPCSSTSWGYKGRVSKCHGASCQTCTEDLPWSAGFDWGTCSICCPPGILSSLIVLRRSRLCHVWT